MVKGGKLTDRYTSTQILERVLYDADEEISRGNRELFFSALAAGFSITLTVLLYFTISSQVTHPIVGALLYPIGFLYIIIGNYQLYTENTLPPVALALERLVSLPSLFKMWLLILTGNVIGGIIGAIALYYGDVLSAEATTQLIETTTASLNTDNLALFFKALFAGVIVAGVVWLDFAVNTSTSRILLIYIAFLAIPLGGLYHIVVSTTEIVYLYLASDVSLLFGINNFLLPVLLGNTVGGSVFVTVVNYFQTPSYVQTNSELRLSLSEWLFTQSEGHKHEKFE